MFAYMDCYWMASGFRFLPIDLVGYASPEARAAHQGDALHILTAQGTYSNKEDVLRADLKKGPRRDQ